MTSVDTREEAEAALMDDVASLAAQSEQCGRDGHTWSGCQYGEKRVDAIRKAARAWAILEHESHGCGVGHLAPCDRLAELRAKQ